MQYASYAEVIEDDEGEARGRERQALERSIGLMEIASMDGASSAERATAIVFTGKLWGVFLEDLAVPGNALPKALRAQIISIGIWIMRELERIRNDPDKGFADVVTVSKAIRDGLL
jgi:flagellar protein FlaF